MKQVQTINPGKRIIICSTQRSGSTMICRDFAQIGWGEPKEYFLQWRRIEKLKKSKIDKIDWLSRLNSILVKASSDNGIVSVKVMAKYLDTIGAMLKKTELEGISNLSNQDAFFVVFKDSYWIRVYRKNKIRQAISRIIAAQTGTYIVYKAEPKKIAESSDKPQKNNKLQFSFEKISNSIKKIEKEEAVWDNFFKRNNIKPIEIVYEEATSDFDYLYNIAQKIEGIELLELPKERQIKKLSNKINEKWYSKYTSLLKDTEKFLEVYSCI